MAQGMGFAGDGESRAEELGFHFAKDSAVGKRKPCAGSHGGGDLEQVLAVHGFRSAMEQHSRNRTLSPGWFDFDEVHFVSVWKWRGPMTTGITGPLACWVCVRPRFGLLGGSGGSGARIGFRVRWLVGHGSPGGAGR